MTPVSSYPGGVSVVICTYNRRRLLEKLVETLLPQLTVDYPLEILIVDNNSSDGTAEYGKALAEANPQFTYVFEGRQGLSHARNTGAREARHAFLQYLDDDVLLPPHYLPTMGPRLAQYDPDFFGGPLYPLYVDEKPAWFPESLEVRKKAAVSGVHNALVLTGANYGVRKAVLQKVGGFDPDYGMTGGKVGMLEERLVIEAYRRMTPPEDQRIYYGLDHFVLNYTPAKRMTVKFQVQRIFIGNSGFIRYSLERGMRSPGQFIGRIWRAFLGEVAAVARMAPRLWRERETEPEKPMLALIKLTYRGADLWGALGFQLIDFGRTARRQRAQGPEDRLLRATLFTLAPADVLPPEIAQVQAAFAAENARLDVVSIAGKSDDDIRRMADSLNLRAEDLVITDMPKAARALAALRGVRPHLQILLWMRDPKPLNYVKSLNHLREKRKGVIGRLRRDRSMLKAADQVIVGADWLTKPLAKLLLPMRGRLYAPPKKWGDEAFQAAWRSVIAEGRVWAPRRLTP